MLRRTLLLILALGLVSATPAFAAIPSTVSYQGLLLDTGGNPVPNGLYVLTFSIYDVASGPDAALWSETDLGVLVTNGLFSVQLGSIVPIPLSFTDEYWLGVKVAADPELTPRTKLAIAPYSAISKSVEDAAITTAKLADDAVTGAKIADGTITAIDIAANAVGQSEIATNGVASAEVQDNTLTENDILDEPRLVEAFDTDGVTNLPVGVFITADQLTIAYPASGIVLVHAYAWVELEHVNGSFSEVVIGLETGPATISIACEGRTLLSSGYPTGIHWSNVAVHRPFVVSGSGNLTVHLNAIAFSGTGNDLHETRLTAVYIPSGSINTFTNETPVESAAAKYDVR